LTPAGAAKPQDRQNGQKFNNQVGQV
jgi:hypothetical protein